MAALRRWSRFSPWPFKASSSDDRQPVKRSARPVIAPVQTLRICFQVKLLAGRVGLNSFYLVLQSLQPPPGAGFLPWRGSQVVRPRSAKPLSPVRFRPAPPTSPENLGLGRGPALRSGFRQPAQTPPQRLNFAALRISAAGSRSSPAATRSALLNRLKFRRRSQDFAFPRRTV